MSTDYRTAKKIGLCDLFDGRLSRFGIVERDARDTTESRRCLTDGNNVLWAYGNDNGELSSLTRYGWNAPGKILAAIVDIFDTAIYSEHEPQYWGFETQEAWDACWKEMDQERREQFHADLLRHVAGDESAFTPGTIGAIQGEIAKKLVQQQPNLAEPGRKDDLLKAVEAIYERDYAVTITLSASDMAFAKMIATHEDDLPQC